jgi:hypothetical protein
MFGYTGATTTNATSRSGSRALHPYLGPKKQVTVGSFQSAGLHNREGA